jgi:uncharacterized membrane protein
MDYETGFMWMVVIVAFIIFLWILRHKKKDEDWKEDPWG